MNRTANRPNVVLIMTDQQRWDFIGYESDRHGNGKTLTPHLDRLAREGTVFHRAYCTSPLCCPSRAAIASGRYGMNSGCFTNLHQLPPGTPTFAQQFRRSGYRTCVIGKTHMTIHAYDSDLTSEKQKRFMDSLGWDEAIEADGMAPYGIRCHYADFLRSHGVLEEYIDFKLWWGYFMDKTRPTRPAFMCREWPFPDELHITSFIGDQAVQWLRRQKASSPFFLQVGFTAPHSPIHPLARFMDLYRELDEPPAHHAPEAPPWLADGRRGYRAMISHVDECVGAMVAALEEAGLAENTVIVYLCDHGEMAGDHGKFGKTTFYEGSARVPLLFWGPGVLRGQQSDALVETIDVGKTLCDLCGVEPHEWDQGKSLAPLLAGTASEHRETVYCEMGCDRMLFDGRYKLMWGEPSFDRRRLGRLHLDKPVNIPPSPPGLYDLANDPFESRNLADDPSHADLRMHMLEKLLARINENTQTQPYLDRGTYKPAPVRSSAEGA